MNGSSTTMIPPRDGSASNRLGIAALISLALLGRGATGAEPGAPAQLDNRPLPASRSEADLAKFYALAKPEHVIAYVETGVRMTPTDRRIATFRKVLTRVDAKYRDGSATIVRLATASSSAIRLSGQASSIRDYLEGAAEWHPTGIPRPPGGWRFSEFVEAYEAARIERQEAHRVALDSLLAAERDAYGLGTGDTSARKALLEKAGIVAEDDFGTRLEKLKTHEEAVAKAEANAAKQAEAAALAKANAPPAKLRSDPNAQKLLLAAQRFDGQRKKLESLKLYKRIVAEYPGTEQAKVAGVQLLFRNNVGER